MAAAKTRATSRSRRHRWWIRTNLRIKGGQQIQVGFSTYAASPCLLLPKNPIRDNTADLADEIYYHVFGPETACNLRLTRTLPLSRRAHGHAADALPQRTFARCGQKRLETQLCFEP